MTPTAAVVEPGTSRRVTIDVTGGGQEPRELRFEVTGAPGEWAMVVPPRLSLPPGGSGQASVVFTVPRSAHVRPGSEPFVVHVSTDGETVELRGVLEVRPFADLRIFLSPRVTRGRRRGQHRLHVDNRGNGPAELALVPRSGDATVVVDVDQRTLALPPGGEESVGVHVDTRRPRLFGRPRSSVFQVVVVSTVGGPDGESAADGLFWQDRLRWPVPLAAAILLVALAAGVLVRGRTADVPVAVPRAAQTTAVAPASPAATCPTGPVDASAEVAVRDFLFCPVTATVSVGGELRWVNRDSSPHTVTADRGEFDTEAFTKDEVRVIRFPTAGTFTYFCRLHPFMRGTVVVSA